jgi:hypothetical protein
VYLICKIPMLHNHGPNPDTHESPEPYEKSGKYADERVASFGERGIDYSHHGQQARPYEKSANSSREFGDQRKVKKTTISKGNPPHNLHASQKSFFRPNTY